MDAMILPTAADVVRSIGETLAKTVAPAVTGTTERSALATIAHLLRYVELRIESEGQIFYDEIAYLGRLLPDAAAWLGDRPATGDLVAAIRAALASERDPAVYPSLAALAREVAGLRQLVCDVLALLQAAGPDERGAAGDNLHAALRRYITWQIEQEGKLVEPAFVGKGPRR